MQLVTPVNDPRLVRSRTTTVPGIQWASRYLNYPVTQLLDLSPHGPITTNEPFRGEPPPNLLIGYFYIARVLNNYLFDQRTYSNLAYELFYEPATFQRFMRWKLLTDCSYTINSGAYSRAIYETEDINETLRQIQNAVLMDRVLTSLTAAEQPIRGFGLAIECQNNSRRALNVGNFIHTFQLSNAAQRDATLFQRICSIRRALFNFLNLTQDSNCVTILDLPFTDCWIAPFISAFEALPMERRDDNTFLQDIVLTMTAGKGQLIGGAMTLRSGTRVGLPFRLRQRDQNLALTETMRRRRGQAISRFVDTLPITRRTRAPRPEQPSQAMEREETESDQGETSGLSREQFNEEIIRTIIELLELLEEELTPAVRRTNFFDFGQQFYAIILSMAERREITSRFLRRWLINFFVIEHLASTLFYLDARFRRHRVSRAHIGVQFAQIIMRARTETGDDLYTRVWFSNQANPFIHLYRRIRHDFVVTTENADTEITYQAQEERDQLLQDINFVENSGEVEDIITQIRTSDAEIDSIELAFRIKFSGLVAYSTNEQVIQSFEEIRTGALQRWRNQQR